MKMSSARVRCKSVPSRELSTLILHRDTGITDPERPFKSQCSCGRWFTALDWHLHGCWTGSEYQYDEPPGLDEYEKFLAYDLLSEALGRAGVLAPIRYEYLSRMGRGRLTAQKTGAAIHELAAAPVLPRMHQALNSSLLNAPRYWVMSMPPSRQSTNLSMPASVRLM